MTTTARQAKMASILQGEVNNGIKNIVQWKPGILVTLIRTEVTADLRYADIFVSVLPEKEQSYVMETLKKERQEIQQYLFSRLGKRVTPTIRFYFDDGGEQQSRIDELIKIAKNSKSAQRRG